MYRRIELINHYKHKDHEQNDFKQGLMGVSTEAVVDAWIYDLRGPYRSIPWNTRFFFTEKGWKEIGKKVIKAAQKDKQDYRVIAIKETDAQVVWKDKHTGYEVAVQPKKRRQ